MPGNPAESLLVDAINYGETYQMPPKSKLPAEEIATLTEWVKRGAPWGVATGTSPAAAHAGAKRTRCRSKNSPREARYWSFQPIKRVPLPTLASGRSGWARNPIDVFIQARLAQHNLAPAPEASRRTLIRRLSF